jgi:hypothetical protein
MPLLLNKQIQEANIMGEVGYYFAFFKYYEYIMNMVPIKWENKTKTCPKCRCRKPATLKYFTPRKTGKRKGRICWCKKCEVSHVIAWAKNNRAQSRINHRKWRLKKEYGMTYEEYNQQLEKQGGVCAICKNPPRGKGRTASILHVDHNHLTGIRRGLLCFPCNAGLGNMQDDPSLLRLAAEYLELYSDKGAT